MNQINWRPAGRCSGFEGGRHNVWRESEKGAAKPRARTVNFMVGWPIFIPAMMSLITN